MPCDDTPQVLVPGDTYIVSPVCRLLASFVVDLGHIDWPGYGASIALKCVYAFFAMTCPTG